MQMQKKLKGNTLIETLVTVLIIAVCIVALIRFQNYLAYDNVLSEQRTEATILGMQKIESLRDYQVLNTTSGYTAYQDIASGTSTFNYKNTTYTLTWTVTSFTNPTYKKIDITVSWTDRNNTSRSVRLITNVASFDPSLPAAIM